MLRAMLLLILLSGCASEPLQLSGRLDRPMNRPVFYESCDAVQAACPDYYDAQWCANNVTCGFYERARTRIHVPHPTSGNLQTTLIGHEVLHWILGPTWEGH